METFRKPAYYFGIKPLEFNEMTCQEIGEYIIEQQKHEKNQNIMDSSIQYRIGEFLVSILATTKPKAIKYDELFPDLIEQQEKQELINAVWRDFLGV